LDKIMRRYTAIKTMIDSISNHPLAAQAMSTNPDKRL